MSGCGYCSDSEVEVEMNWNTTRGQEKTGPMCANCAHTMWEKLQKFPDAIGTLTISQVTK